MLALTISASAASAADLAAHSRIGALFAEPAAPRRAVAVVRPQPVEEDIVSYAPEIDVRRKVGGYYGKPDSYFDRSYYNTPPALIFSRAPYACGFYGYC
jgi:hypothetical protein